MRRLLLPLVVFAALGGVLLAEVRLQRDAEPIILASASATRAEPPPPRPHQEPSPRLVVPELVAPQGDRVEADQRVVITLDQALPRDAVEARFSIEPAAAGRLHWSDAQTLEFEPRRWAPGQVYRVILAGDESPELPLVHVEWTFRAAEPFPERMVPGNGARVVFTFDDGTRDPEQARVLLDVLRTHKVRALMFPTGRWAARNSAWTRQARRDGHRICNHTYSHRDLTDEGLSVADLRDEIRRGAGHGECDLFRPPGRAIDSRVRRVAAELGYRVLMWDIDSRDWSGVEASDVARRVLRLLRPGATVLFHIHSEATLAALPVIVRRAREAGYELSYRPRAGATRRSSRPMSSNSE